MTWFSRKLLSSRRAGLLLLALTAVLPAGAATRTWTGGGTNALWSNPANWDGGTVPSSGDVLVFSPDALRKTITNDLPSGISFESLDIEGHYDMSGNSIQIGAGGLHSSQSKLLFSSITLLANQKWTAYALVKVGPTNINGFSLTFAPDASGAVSVASISGTGTLTAAGEGTSIIEASTFTGDIVRNCCSSLQFTGSGGNVSSSSMVFFRDASVGSLTASGPGNYISFGSLGGGATTTRDVTLSGSLAEFRMNSSRLVACRVTGSISLADVSLSVIADDAFVQGTVLTLFDNDGTDPVGGTFVGNPEGTIITSFGKSWRLSYVGGTGNDVTLTMLDTPRVQTFSWLSTTPNPALPGQTFAMTAAVSSNDKSTTPTGTVTFWEGTTPLGSPAPVISGRATLSTSLATVGWHTLKAVYNGDDKFASATSDPYTQYIGAKAVVNVVSMPNPEPFEKPATFTVTVSGSAGTPTGTVTLLYDSQTYSPVALDGAGTARITDFPFSPGTHRVIAVYNGDSTYYRVFSDTLTHMVDEPLRIASAVKLVSSANPSLAGQPVTFTAAVTAIDGKTPTGGVITFIYDGQPTSSGQPLDESGRASITTSTLPTGAHSIVATYTGDGTYDFAVSNAIAQTVNPPNASTPPPPRQRAVRH